MKSTRRHFYIIPHKRNMREREREQRDDLWYRGNYTNSRGGGGFEIYTRKGFCLEFSYPLLTGFADLFSNSWESCLSVR